MIETFDPLAIIIGGLNLLVAVSLLYISCAAFNKHNAEGKNK